MLAARSDLQLHLPVSTVQRISGYESEVKGSHEDGTVSMIAGLAVGVCGLSPQAPEVLVEVGESLEFSAQVPASRQLGVF